MTPLTKLARCVYPRPLQGKAAVRIFRSWFIPAILDPGGFELDIDVLAGFPANIPPHRIVPVRFARALEGFADSSAPDLDDHGFTLRDGGSAHGPVVGIERGTALLGTIGSGPESRVKLIRDGLDARVALFPTMEDESMAETIFPARGDPIDPDGTSDPNREPDIIAFRATSTSNSVQDCKLFIHHGSAGGSVERPRARPPSKSPLRTGSLLLAKRRDTCRSKRSGPVASAFDVQVVLPVNPAAALHSTRFQFLWRTDRRIVLPS